MKRADLKQLEISMRAIGADLVSWRADDEARTIHSKSEMKLEADRRAHARLTEALHTSFGDVPIISEEDAEHSLVRPSAYWLIDPIDGSASWYNGFDGFVTQAAFIENGVPTAGLVYAPASDRFFVSASGEGAYLNDEALPKLTPRAGLTMTDNTPDPHGITQRLARALKATDYLESGSLGLKSCLVACGDADVFVKDVLVRDWDMAPAICMLKELGGHIVQLDGQAYDISGLWEKKRGFVVARTEQLAQQVLAANDALQDGDDR